MKEEQEACVSLCAGLLFGLFGSLRCRPDVFVGDRSFGIRTSLANNTRLWKLSMQRLLMNMSNIQGCQIAV